MRLAMYYSIPGPPGSNPFQGQILQSLPDILDGQATRLIWFRKLVTNAANPSPLLGQVCPMVRVRGWPQVLDSGMGVTPFRSLMRNKGKRMLEFQAHVQSAPAKGFYHDLIANLSRQR